MTTDIAMFTFPYFEASLLHLCISLPSRRAMAEIRWEKDAKYDIFLTLNDH